MNRKYYWHNGARTEVIAASLIFLHDYSAEQVEAWIAEHEPHPEGVD